MGGQTGDRTAGRSMSDVVVLNENGKIHNSFHSIQFSFAKIEDGMEISMYPNELRVSVYTSKEAFKQGKPAFKFEYVTEFNKDDLYDQNNIKDNPDSFQIVFRDV